MLKRYLESNATPLIATMPGVISKFECNNPGGSHKVRAARHIVRRAVEEGKITPGSTTIIEKTGGNFGFGLAVACSEFNVPLELAVGLGFSPVKRACLEFFGAELIGIPMMRDGAKPKDVIGWHLENASSLGKNYFYTDQFNNPHSLEAHFLSTGPELVAQIASDFPSVTHITFVTCAGTGATAMGVRAALLNAGFDLRMVLVEPEGCDATQGIFKDHRMEGMSVGVVPPFLDFSVFDEYCHVTMSEVIALQRRLSTRLGYFLGNTSAACAVVAEKFATTSERHRTLTFVYDHGLWYINSVLGLEIA